MPLLLPAIDLFKTKMFEKKFLLFVVGLLIPLKKLTP